MIPLTPEIKAQLAEQKKQCIFCKLISREIPAKTVFEDDATIAMLDIYPAVKGHTLFMPKEHYPILPYLSAEESTHLFSLIPSLVKAVKEGLVATAFNIFIANGGAAGQQAPHFLLHLLPREKGDGFYNFLFDKKGKSLAEEQKRLLMQSIPGVLQRYLKSAPSTVQPPFLQKVYSTSTVLYEDEKLVCVLPDMGIAPGQVQIYNKKEEQFIEKLPAEECHYLFSASSLIASVLFETLKVQGTNILLKSGITDDNPDGLMGINIIPRIQEDHLQSLSWQPKQPGYDLDGVMEKIKDKIWKVKYKAEKKEAVLPATPQILKIKENELPKRSTHHEEIKQAIEKIRA